MNGSLIIVSASPMVRRNEPTAVAIVSLYGGRGGLKSVETIDREGAVGVFKDVGHALTSTLEPRELETVRGMMPAHVEAAIDLVVDYAVRLATLRDPTSITSGTATHLVAEVKHLLNAAALGA